MVEDEEEEEEEVAARVASAAPAPAESMSIAGAGTAHGEWTDLAPRGPATRPKYQAASARQVTLHPSPDTSTK